MSSRRKSSAKPGQLTLFAADSLAKMLASPDSALAWQEAAPVFGLSSYELLSQSVLSGSSSKTSPVFYPVTPDAILPSSFKGWRNAGMASAGGYLTLNISESPNDAAASLLSDILERDAPLKYFLSVTAGTGIMRRANNRNKPLPPLMLTALTALVASAGDHSAE